MTLPIVVSGRASTRSPPGPRRRPGTCAAEAEAIVDRAVKRESPPAGEVEAVRKEFDALADVVDAGGGVVPDVAPAGRSRAPAAVEDLREALEDLREQVAAGLGPAPGRGTRRTPDVTK